MCTLVRRQSGNFAKSWGRHPSIMKKKCIKKVLFLSGSTIKAITLSDKYQLHKAAQIFFTLNTFIFKRKWSKLVILLLWVIIRIIKVCTQKCAHYRSNSYKISVSDKKVNSQNWSEANFFYISLIFTKKQKEFPLQVNIMPIFV